MKRTVRSICVATIALLGPGALAQPATRPSLDDVGPQHPTRVQFEQHLAKMQEMRQELELQIHQMRDALQKQTGRPGATPQNVRAAIDTLEAQVARINGNREYLRVLRDAYRAYIQELRLAKRDAEAQSYARRMEILDPQSKADNPKATILDVKPAPSKDEVLRVMA